MKHLLSAESSGIFKSLATSAVLVALDYDGTLAPIVDRPEDAWIPPRHRESLREVACRYPCIVVSGRGQRDLMYRLRGIPVREVIGNHGLEPRRYSHALASRVQQWTRALRAAVGALPGVEIEDKIFSLAIHYRSAADPAAARLSIQRSVAELAGARIIGGKAVVNLVPVAAPHKGEAVEAARERLSCDRVLYVGDDETDEDVFRAGDARVWSVRVGASGLSKARFFVRDQDEVADLLERLIEVRAV